MYLRGNKTKFLHRNNYITVFIVTILPSQKLSQTTPWTKKLEKLT